MDFKEKNIIYTPKANIAILKMHMYMLNSGYPHNAQKFYDQLYEFGGGLKLHFHAHALCRLRNLAKRKMRCAIFKKNYIFIYRVEGDEVVIPIEFQNGD